MNKTEIDPWFLLTWAICVILVPFRILLFWSISVAVHELGHLIAILILRIPIYKISLRFGGVHIHTNSMPPAQEIVVAMSGPVAGMLLFLICYNFPLIRIIAMLQTIINLIPLYPTDGGRVVASLLRLLFKDRAAAGIMGVIEIVLYAVFTFASVAVIGRSGGLWITIGVMFFLLKIKLSCKQERQEIQ